MLTEIVAEKMNNENRQGRQSYYDDVTTTDQGPDPDLHSTLILQNNLVDQK